LSGPLDNQLLARLDEASFSAIAPELITISLDQGKTLNETHSAVRKVYFPHSGMISCVVQLANGAAIESGMIGRDGEYGAQAALEHKLSLNLVMVQVQGQASVMNADKLRYLAVTHPPFMSQLMGYEQFFTAQVQQTCACNAVHQLAQRICKWLLRMHKLVGDELPLTHEFLAEMLGVRRTSVTLVASRLQKAGLIAYKRGDIRIVDLSGVRVLACECDGVLNAHYSKIFQLKHEQVQLTKGSSRNLSPMDRRGADGS
jgi:CRP-like cAMP-binding protein